MKKILIIALAAGAIASAAPNGAEIFKNCAICHGDQAQKRSLNVSKTIAGMDAKHIVRTLKEYQIGKLDQYGYGRMMQGQATKLSEAQMQAVAKYVASLPPVKISEKEKPPLIKDTDKTNNVKYNSFTKSYFEANPDATSAEAKKAWEAEKTASQ